MKGKVRPVVARRRPPRFVEIRDVDLVAFFGTVNEMPFQPVAPSRA
jgi:hypothetical protein